MQNNFSNPGQNNRETVYAGFWVRAAAYILDGIVVFAGLLFVRLALLTITALAQGTALDGNLLFHYTLKDIILYLSQVLYFILCTYFTGTTLGKRAMNLKVVNGDGSHKLKFMNVVYRETIGRFLSWILVGMGYIMAGIDREKRGLHDILCDTRVVYEKNVKVNFIYPRMVQPVPPVYNGTAPVPNAGPYPGNPGQPRYTVPGNEQNKERESMNETTGF